ncbi:MAG TPA: hypothetical protein VEA40_00680 [Ramlibacter sp.]|nr:hypothetical protein [Ramlibacter sp.]
MNTSAAPAPGPVSRWEWCVAAVGAVLVAACIGYLAWLAVAGDRDAAAVDPRVDVVGLEQTAGGHFHVRVQVHNAGSEPAAALKVAGQLRENGRVVEEAETEFEFLPAQASRRAGLFFRQDPRRAELVVFARSHQAP